MTDRYIDNSGSNTSAYDTWAKAATTITTGIASVTNADRGFVSNDHTSTATAAITWTFPSSVGYQLLGVNTAATEPPTGLNSTPAAVEAVGAASAAFTLAGFAYVYGIKMQGGTNNSSACTVVIGGSTNPGGLFLENCALELLTVNTSVYFQIGGFASGAVDDNEIVFTNTSFKFGATAHSLKLGSGRITMRNISLDSAGSTPTTLFTSGGTGSGGRCLVEASDLSGESWTNLVTLAWPVVYDLTFRNCKLPAGFALTTGTHSGPGGLNLKVHNCDSGDTQYNFGEVSYAGSAVDESTIVRTGGGATSVRMDSSANVKFPYLPLTVEGAIYNSTLSARTLTVEVIHSGVGGGGSGDFTDAELWVEIQHQGTSGFPLGVIDIDDRAANVFATPADQPNSSETWASSPATPVKQYLQCSFTPAEVGYVHFKVCLAMASKTVYVDLLGATLA